MNGKVIKIAHISDTHGNHQFLDDQLDKDIDVIIHSGDFSNAWGDHSYLPFLKWYADLPIKHKLFICGNHEIQVEKDPKKFSDAITDHNLLNGYMEHNALFISEYGLMAFGSPYTPEFHNWAFNKSRYDLSQMWDDIPIDTDILITHGPPFGVGDRCGYYREKIVGDISLLYELSDIGKYRKRPMIHQFGHIHEDAGEYKCEALGNWYRGINASFMDESYEPNGEVHYSFLNTEKLHRSNGTYEKISDDEADY